MAAATPAEPRIADEGGGAYRELFLLAGWLRAGEIPAQRVPATRAFIQGSLRDHRRELLRMGMGEERVADGQLAIIALLDECANGSPVREVAEQWQRETLQYAYYSHNNLGRDFFERLAHWQAQRDDSGLLEHYAQCLAWGLAGRYQQENRLADLAGLRESVQRELHRRRRARPPLQALLAELQPLPPMPLRLPARAVIGLAAGVLILLYVTLATLLYRHGGEVASTLRIEAVAAARASRGEVY